MRDLITFEIKGSRGADSAVVRLVSFGSGRGKEVPNIRCLRRRVYSMDIVQSSDVPTDYPGEGYLVDIADLIGMFDCRTQKHKLLSDGINFSHILCTADIISFA